MIYSRQNSLSRALRVPALDHPIRRIDANLVYSQFNETAFIRVSHLIWQPNKEKVEEMKAPKNSIHFTVWKEGCDLHATQIFWFRCPFALFDARHDHTFRHEYGLAWATHIKAHPRENRKAFRWVSKVWSWTTRNCHLKARSGKEKMDLDRPPPKVNLCLRWFGGAVNLN